MKLARVISTTLACTALSGALGVVCVAVVPAASVGGPVAMHPYKTPPT